MFDPMWDPPPATFLGVPLGYVILGLGVVGMLIGLRWIFRIYADEPEPKSFYATADRHRAPRLGLILLIALSGLFLIGFSIFFVTIGGPGDPNHPTLSINDQALIAGIALELVAATLLIRRLWVRSRS